MGINIHQQPKQELLAELLSSTGPKVATIIGAGGAKGGGKSEGARGIALICAGELGEIYPGLVITIVRRTYGDLKKNHIDPLIRKYPDLMRFYKADAEEFNLGKAKIVFMYAENDKDVKRKFLGGYESAIIIIDEAQQFSEEELQWITTAARWTDSSGVGIPAGLCKTLMLFNPGGPGSSYIRRVFWLKQYVGEEKRHKYAFIHIFGYDNFEWFRGQVDITESAFYAIRGKCSDVGEQCTDLYDSEGINRSRCCRFQMFIHQTEEGQKYNAYPESMRAGYLLGSFESFSGQYFAGTWYEKKHVLPSALVDDLIQYWWTAWLATDWGYGEKHWCFTYWAATGKIAPSTARHALNVIVEKPIDIIIIYRELMVHRMEEADFAHRLVEITPEPERKALARWVAGSDTKQMLRHMRHSPREIIDGICSPYGFPTIQSAHDEPGSRAVNAGMMRGMLHRTARMVGASEPLNLDEQQEKLPLVFVSSECPKLISAIPVLLDDSENGKPEDVQKLEQWEDDAFDSCKYLLAEYASVKDQAPREVRLYDTMMQAKDATVKLSAEGQDAAANHNAYMAMLKFDRDENVSRRRGRRM